MAIIFSNIGIQKIGFETSYNSLGILLKRSGRIEEAIETYRKAIDSAPLYPSPYYNLGILYRDTGRMDKAAPLFKKALELDPGFYLAEENLRDL